jgi:hypothetical protein
VGTLLLCNFVFERSYNNNINNYCYSWLSPSRFLCLPLPHSLSIKLSIADG